MVEVEELEGKQDFAEVETRHSFGKAPVFSKVIEEFAPRTEVKHKDQVMFLPSTQTLTV